MKTKQTIIFAGLIVLASALLVLSCDNPLSLGEKLDLDGPVLEFTSPDARTIGEQFTLRGNVADRSAVDSLLITATRGAAEFPKYWRYTRAAGWQVSEDNGANWTDLPNAEWNENADFIEWVVPVYMTINGTNTTTAEGEYMFTAQAWDSGGMSDDNSLRTRVLIFDKIPPKVEVYNPPLHSRYFKYDSATDAFDDKDFQDLRAETDWRKPELLGKFLTQEFLLQWQIIDNHDVSSIDIRFYGLDVGVDGYPDTPLPDTYFYRYQERLPPPSPGIMPNGSANVPVLDAITQKTTLQVVGLCYDAANHVNQEKVLGYFIYWPEARAPWITFTDGMEKPEVYKDMTAPEFEAEAFKIYPGRSIKATAFQAQGVSRVEYTLHSFIVGVEPDYSAPISLAYMNLNEGDYTDGQTKVVIRNTERKSGDYSTIFPWDFTPPARSAYYVVRAQAFDFNGNAGDFYNAAFRVQDITFPDFPTPPNPIAGTPLFEFIGKDGADPDSIRIHGRVADATAITSVYMVWINPQSKGYAGMSQLAYFRDSNYIGWRQAIDHDPALADGDFIEQDDYDSGVPNKVWKLKFDYVELNADNRQEYEYTQTIPLTDLNISTADQPLKSQVFLLRAEGTDPTKCTIITYAPQGDESSPEIKITEVRITGRTDPLIPNQYGVVEQFTANQTITINGTWKEDSVAFLPIASYFTNNLKVSVNGTSVTPTLTQAATSDDNGTWTASITTTAPAGNFPADSLKDTLVVNAQVSDIGGNSSETGASWLIESDHLQLMRISSEKTDATYNAGEVIDIFLEFNKAVQLKTGVADPVLTLNTTGGATATATYQNYNSQSTRHYFRYTVGASQNAARLDVTGIQVASGITWTSANYPFTWHRGDEEIRITTESGHNGGKPTGQSFYARQLPTPSSGAGDTQFTLASGKNIKIDTTAPTVTGITSSQGGNYTTGAVISITVTFDEPVQFTGTPQLRLLVNNGTNTTLLTNGSVSGNTTNALTFLYTVNAGDTTREDTLRITDNHSGTITDLAGNALSTTAISGHANAPLGNDKYIDALDPAPPTVRLFSTEVASATNANTITSRVNNADVRGFSDTAAKTLANVYHPDLYLAIQGATTSVGGTSTGQHKIARLEYSIRGNQGDSTNWVRFANETNTPIVLPQPGTYSLVARQIDRAGNVSAVTQPLNFTWDPGNLISRIDSTTANGTYSYNPNPNTINVTVYFRKALNLSGNQTITLNARRGTQTNFNQRAVITVPATATATNVTQYSFTYTIEDTDNTPTATDRTQYLDVTALTLNATDTGSTDINGAAVPNSNATASAYLTLPTDTANLLGQRKDLIVQTGALAVSSGPTYAITAANDEATGTISITFNRTISKGNGTGNITIAQITTGYRLPAVLTEAQSTRYRNARNFNTYYTRGTNGFSNGSADTATKFVLNYAETTVVTPNNTGTAIQQMAFDFHDFETVKLPVTSQDVTVSGSVLTINLNGSNALQVLGASYTVTIPQNCVQDSLGYRWPTAAAGQVYDTNTNRLTTPSINKSFVRIDKRTNRDSVARTTGNGSVTNPWLTANLDNVRQTTARLDCRTPDSVVRYNVTEQRFDARGANGTGTGTTTATGDGATGNPPRPSQTGTDTYWKNIEGNANNISYLSQPADPQTNGTNYTNFTGTNTNAAGPHIQVGDNTEHGYVWRIYTKSRNNATGNTYGDASEEIAFRTVLTVQLDGMVTNSLGAPPASGDQLWIRGGDAISSSSVPGFPLTWSDDFNSLRTDGKRAGIRLMTMKSVTTNFGTTSEWKWITWEVNVETFYDIVLGRDTATTQAPNAAQAWQYGPRAWAYQRGGWSVLKDRYSLYPGKHRWVRITGGDYNPGGALNFSHTFSNRPDLAPSITQ